VELRKRVLKRDREASKVGHYRLESNKDNESMLTKGVLKEHGP